MKPQMGSQEKEMIIYKYKLSAKDVQYVLMPDGAEILTVQTQEGEPYIWALVDPYGILANVCIEIFGTGHLIPEGKRRYIGTYQTSGYVFHVYQRIG